MFFYPKKVLVRDGAVPARNIHIKSELFVEDTCHKSQAPQTTRQQQDNLATCILRTGRECSGIVEHMIVRGKTELIKPAF